MIDRILANLDDNYTLDKLKEMIRIPSVVGQEGEMAAYLYNELKALGYDCELHEVAPGRPNVYARLTGSGPGKRLHFNGHMDTVPVCEDWTKDPFEPLEEPGRIYGLGACDMKGGIACTLNLLRAFARANPAFKGELSFSATIDEEGYSKGARALLATDFAEVDAMVLAEPFSGIAEEPIPLGITGKLLYDVMVKGKAAHGFTPLEGINAVEEDAKILANLDQLPLREDRDFGCGSYATLKIEGGYSVYAVVVPDRCRFEVNRLLVPGETVAMAVTQMQDLVDGLGLDAEVEINLKAPRYEAFVMSRDEPILKLFTTVYEQVTGMAPHFNFTSDITDAILFAGEAGIPSRPSLKGLVKPHPKLKKAHRIRLLEMAWRMVQMDVGMHEEMFRQYETLCRAIHDRIPPPGNGSDARDRTYVPVMASELVAACIDLGPERGLPDMPFNHIQFTFRFNRHREALRQLGWIRSDQPAKTVYGYRYCRYLKVSGRLKVEG